LKSSFKMNSQELRALQEAYNQVYELDENRMASRMGKMPSAPAKVGKATHSIKDIAPSKAPSPKEKAKARKALGLGEAKQPFPHKKVDRQVYDAMDSGETAGDSGNAAKEKRDYGRAEKMRSVAAKQGGKTRANEAVDLYDIILSHLLDEGYADTEQAAEAIMVNMSEDWRESIVEEVLDEAEGSYGQTPKAQQKMGDLANKRRNTPASEYSERGEKKKKVDAAVKHSNRMSNPDAGDRGKKSTKPYWTSDTRKGMTQKDRDWSRGADEYGHSGYDGEGGGGSLPKGKKLERQRKSGVSD
jgi:hypothetical protein